RGCAGFRPVPAGRRRAGRPVGYSQVIVILRNTHGIAYAREYIRLTERVRVHGESEKRGSGALVRRPVAGGWTGGESRVTLHGGRAANNGAGGLKSREALR